MIVDRRLLPHVDWPLIGALVALTCIGVATIYSVTWDHVAGQPGREFWTQVYALPVAPVDILSVLAGLSRMTARRFLLVACSGYIPRTAIAALLGSSLAEYAGMSAAMSVIGAVFLTGVIVWLWKRTVHAAQEPG